MKIQKLMSYEISDNCVVDSPRNIVPYLEQFRDYPEEQLIVVCLNGANLVTSINVVAIGSRNKALFTASSVFRCAIVDNASGIILSHNHPCGNSDPSSEDVEVTENLKKAGDILGIKVLDHVIMGKYTYFSFLEHSLTLGTENGQ